MSGVVHGLKINDAFLGNAPENYLVRMTGNGNGGGTEDTGWLNESFVISLPAGTIPFNWAHSTTSPPMTTKRQWYGLMTWN